jgi:hypothetical protein
VRGQPCCSTQEAVEGSKTIAGDKRESDDKKASDLDRSLQPPLHCDSELGSIDTLSVQ